MKQVTLDYPTIQAIAKEVAKLLRRERMDEMVTTEEAAAILGITPSRMRQIKDKFPHAKKGASMQGRLLFRKADLLEGATI